MFLHSVLDSKMAQSHDINFHDPMEMELDNLDWDNDPFSVSDDSDKDPDYEKEPLKAKKIPDYFGLHKNTNQAGSSQASASISNTRQLEPSQTSISSTSTITEVEGNGSLHSHSGEASALFDGVFYTITQEGPNYSVTAKCQSCIPKIKYIKGRSNSTTNFLKHIKTKHPEEYQKYLDHKKK